RVKTAPDPTSTGCPTVTRPLLTNRLPSTHGWFLPDASLPTPELTACETARCAVLTAIPLMRAAMLTPTMTLLNPSVMAFGTTGMSLQEVATSGATNPSGPPFTVTLGLPTADEPWSPGYGSGGNRSLTHVGHFVKALKLALMDSHVVAVLVVSIPVTSLRKLSAAPPFGFGI